MYKRQIVGFVALALMRFTIGRDLGFVLAKGIVCSLATVLVLMPALILRFQERIRKTQHRSFVPSMDGFSRKLFSFRKVLAVAVLLVIVPAFVAQNMIDFKYGTSAVGCSEGTQSYEDLQLMEERFGKSNMLLVLVPDVYKRQPLSMAHSIMPSSVAVGWPSVPSGTGGSWTMAPIWSMVNG